MLSGYAWIMNARNTGPGQVIEHGQETQCQSHGVGL